MPALDTLTLPTRGSSEVDLDQFNRLLRQSSGYQRFMQRNGLPTTGRVKLSRAQQAAFERELAGAGFPIPSGMHVDQGGNLNQKNRLGKTSIIVAASAAAAFGIPAVFAASSAAAGTAGAVTLGTSGAGTTGAVLGSAGVGATAGGAAGTGAAVTTGGLAGLSRGTVALVGAGWGLDFFNNWLQSRAESNRFQASLGLSAETLEQRKKEFEASLALDRDRLGLSREEVAERRRQFDESLAVDKERLGLSREEVARRAQEFADTLALEREKFGTSKEQFGKELTVKENEWADRFGLDTAMWQQQEATRAPYRSAGEGGLRALSRGLGVEMQPVERVPAPRPSPRVTTQPDASSGMATAERAGMVPMVAPDGTRRQIPLSQVAYYESLGATRAA